MTPQIGPLDDEPESVAGTGDRPLHIAHATEAPRGGVVVYLNDLVSRQIAAGLRVDLVTPEINLDMLRDVVRGCGAVVTYPQPHRSAMSLIRLARRTVAHTRHVRPDILHVHSTFAGVILRLCRPLLPRRTRIVYCPHGWAFSRLGNRAASVAATLMERMLAPFADRIVCISDYEYREARRIGILSRRLAVIENGIGPWTGPKSGAGRRREGPLLIGFAGRFDRQKGFDTFEQVVRRLGSKIEAVAVGSAITDRMTTHDLPSNLRVLGWQPREVVHAMLRDVDLLLMPSRWEGFGLVAAEAMQAATPVFASRVGALADIVIDDETGRLFDPDDVDAIAAEIETTSRATLRRYGEAGHRRYLDRYTADRMAREMSDLYRDVRHP